MARELLIKRHIEPETTTDKDNVQCISFDDVAAERNTTGQYVKQHDKCFSSKCHPSKSCYAGCNA